MVQLCRLTKRQSGDIIDIIYYDLRRSIILFTFLKYVANFLTFRWINFMKIQNNTPDVSVIVPVYNVEKYVEKCLMSLLAQDCNCSYEIIVVDDGSGDGSSAIVDRMAEGSDIIRIFRQPNSGVSAARNNGLLYARGKYVIFVDSDDHVEPNYISALYQAAEDNGAQIACCNYRRVNDEERSI